ncbi:hypothetical protein PCYB_115000 [Plasmodium cynomolgi strain B]|uniref:Uncharacterized protein n=1 Tax=Plasmodium cynomolgi (strain B) TaxID=1120755 RepID=K6UY67_PLACD|nr:hypothetical protein PCYB_115000 [Plasmodium cynomolgi strain B]GAB67480.1 hypothetical protein PCYB_115000 [Plasmodium cynomolgi strain B]
MGLAVFENDKNLSFNGVDKIVDDVYKDNLNFLLKSNKNELERKETDQLSFSIDNLLILLEEEEQRRYGERDKMKDAFQNIGKRGDYCGLFFIPFHMRLRVMLMVYSVQTGD